MGSYRVERKMNHMTLQDKDAQLIWHPFTQEKTAELNILIESAKGVWLKGEDGREILDGISSWWTNVHGHGNEYMAKAIYNQALKMEHLIFAGFTHPKAIELSERIIGKVGEDYSKVFFSDNGSTSNEVALKMAIQYHYNTGTPKNKIIAFQDSYHGDTFGVMSTGGRGAFSAPFDPNLFDVYHLDVPNKDNEATILQQFKSFVGKGDVAAFAFEPLVMGTAGMIMYSESLLEELVEIAHENNVITICDEVFTGFYRTGKMFSFQHTNIKPDILCLSKGLTGGMMALGLTVCKSFIYDAFYSNDKMKAFFHGHSYTGNPIACSAACASLDLFDSQPTQDNISNLLEMQFNFSEELKQIKHFKNVRLKGTILAFDVISKESTSYFNSIRDVLYNYFLEKDILLRPLGNTLYILPPYSINNLEYELIKDAVLRLEI